MALPDIFSKEVSEQLISRINQLSADTQPQWGKMDAAKMLAHCCVTYEYVYSDKYPKPNALVRLMLKWMIKGKVVSEQGYPKNGSTAPDFIIKSEKDFNQEKERLVQFIRKTSELGRAHFEGKESHSFGPLTATEWNNMFYKHLHHHLTQFGV